MLERIICTTILAIGCHKILSFVYEAGVMAAEQNAEIDALKQEIKELKEKLKKTEG
jgi:hypothetical protein